MSFEISGVGDDGGWEGGAVASGLKRTLYFAARAGAEQSVYDEWQCNLHPAPGSAVCNRVKIIFRRMQFARPNGGYKAFLSCVSVASD